MTEFAPLSEVAREMGINPETLRLAAVAGEVPGARLFRRRWVVHRPTLTAAWTAKAEAPKAQPRLLKGTGIGRKGGTLARIASSL